MKNEYFKPIVEIVKMDQDILLLSTDSNIYNGDGTKQDPWGNQDFEY